MENIKQTLKKCREEYPKNTLFYSATGNLKTPIRVSSLDISDVYKNTVVNSEGGVIYDDGIYAKKV